MAVILQDGMRRMYEQGEDVFYYVTMYNEDYAMPEMPEGVREGIVRGIYKLKAAPGGKAVAQLFGSGPILNEVCGRRRFSGRNTALRPTYGA
jgi:pyruvate dehydrogenase E1 component